MGGGGGNASVTKPAVSGIVSRLPDAAEEKRLDEEAKALQNERLKREKELADRQRKEQEAIAKAQRFAGGASLIKDDSTTLGGFGAYSSLLGD